MTPTLCQTIKLWWLGRKMKSAFEAASYIIRDNMLREMRQREFNEDLTKKCKVYWNYFESLDKRNPYETDSRPTTEHSKET